MTENVEPTILVCDVCGKAGWKSPHALRLHKVWHEKKAKAAAEQAAALEGQKGMPPELPPATEAADPTQVSLPNINPVTPEVPQPAQPVQPLQPPVAQPSAAPVAQPVAPPISVVPDNPEPVAAPVEVPQPPPMPTVQPPAVQPLVSQPQPTIPVPPAQEVQEPVSVPPPAPPAQEPPAVAPPAPVVQPPAVAPPAPEVQPLAVAPPTPPQSVAPPPPMTPTPELPGIPTSVNIGDVVRLVGQIWWKASQTGQWEVAAADNLDASVIQKEVVSGKTLLICRAVGGSAIWGILEEMVFQGMIKLVKKAPTNGAGLADFRPPDDLQIDVSEQLKQERQARVEYGKKLIQYANAKNEQDRADKFFKEVSRGTRPDIEGYVREYGVESETDKGDFVVNDLGYRSHLIRVQGKEIVKMDEEAIVAWLITHGHNSALKNSLNHEVYAKMKEAGVVPPELIQQTETLTKQEDSWRLKVTVDPHWNWGDAQDIKDEIFADETYDLKTSKA